MAGQRTRHLDAGAQGAAFAALDALEQVVEGGFARRFFGRRVGQDGGERGREHGRIYVAVQV